ncbi:transporter substrate-binding domain-containing protein [Kutzneria sp. 744]|uniref:transporter substrate-binding domain-containing protein n=1 Tax=Kutzneria sp. (strain 744) TaxID=345341 RepID=UPI0003EEB722|nr:transporter substrate-binding domain-containing protein [Kutzneria sp. 744]EWM09940.1 glutamine ABC transporter periplasmic-binding protein [Kutzneria sp. 744]
MFRSGVLGISLAALAMVLTACGSATAEDPAAATSSVPYPTQDVVSSLAVDVALHAELPPSTTSLTLGTTLSPGTASLPHGGTVNGKNVGLDVDLRDAVAKVLGITWTVQNGTFETIIPGVQNGKYDVGQDNFGVTAAREKVVDFATYLSDGQSFLGPADHGPTGVKTLQDLCGLTVATSPGSTFQQILTSGADKCAAAGKKPYSVQLFSDTAPIWLGLANGKVDVYFGPTLSLKYDETHVPNTKFLGQFSSTPVGFVTGKGSPVAKAVSDAVNKLIATGDYAKILGKWGVDSSGITQSAVSPTPTL